MFRQPKASSSSQAAGASGTVRKSGGSSRGQPGMMGGCKYPHRVCGQLPLDHYEYCIKHILEDKNAPYKPCGYTYAINNKRCLQPAPRGDKRDIGYCAAHLWKTQLKRQRSMAKYVPPVTREALLAGLAHYVRPIRGANKSASTIAIASAGGGGNADDMSNLSSTRAINPFVEADISKAALWRAHVLECASESDSDVEAAHQDSVWSATNEDSSDAESVDSTIDDPLRHAGVYTAEEAATITRNKLLRLQKLYRRQFDRLAHVLKERRRNYLHALKKEKETYCTIYDQSRTSAKEQKLYDKLKALNRYQSRSTSETLAHMASIEKRARETGGANYKPTGHNAKCTFTEGGVRCPRVTLPLTKFCFKHILDDPNQSIFRACGCRKADSTECQEAVCNSLCSGDTCLLHIKLPQLPHLNLPNSPSDEIDKKDEDSSRGRSLMKMGGDESEFDASATESAFSTDNPRESPDASRDNSPEGPVGALANATKKIPKAVDHSNQEEDMDTVEHFEKDEVVEHEEIVGHEEVIAHEEVVALEEVVVSES